MADPEIETVTVLKSTRVGFTKLLVGYLCFRIATDPDGLLVVQPAGDDAAEFSKDDIAPALEATPAVHGLVGDPKSRDSDNTILWKHFPGGWLKVIGAHSGRGFRRVTAGFVGFDEVDAYPPSAGAEGDQIELGKKRAHTAAFPKFILGSSPKLKATSRIWKSWEESDQRDRFLPCPHCDHGQRLRWGGKDVDFGLKWPEGHPEQAYYLCENCHAAIEHHELGRMEEQGRWIAARPEVPSHAGFRIWAAYSPFPKAAWGVLAKEFLDCKNDPPRLQVFVNTVLGEPYEQRGRAPGQHKLMARREALPSRVVPGSDPERREPMMPRASVVLTSFTDVQLNRLETGIEAWGPGEENWKLAYHVLYGDPTAAPIWAELWDLLRRPIPFEGGGVDYIRSSCVDSGYAAQSVYSFVRTRAIYVPAPGAGRAFLWPTKGDDGPGHVWPRKPGKNAAKDVPVYTVKVDAAKDAIYARLADVTEPGPGYIHFPDFLSEDYFRQLTAEQAMDKRDKKGFPVRVYELKAGRHRNEALDVAVGNYAALCALYAMGLTLDRLAARRQRPVSAESSGPPPAAPPFQVAPGSAPAPQSPAASGRRRIGSRWMGR